MCGAIAGYLLGSEPLPEPVADLFVVYILNDNRVQLGLILQIVSKIVMKNCHFQKSVNSSDPHNP